MTSYLQVPLICEVGLGLEPPSVSHCKDLVGDVAGPGSSRWQFSLFEDPLGALGRMQLLCPGRGVPRSGAERAIWLLSHMAVWYSPHPRLFFQLRFTLHTVRVTFLTYNSMSFDKHIVIKSPPQSITCSLLLSISSGAFVVSPSPLPPASGSH